MFALGYKRDKEDPNDFTTDELLGFSARAEVVIPASMRPYRGAPMEQLSAASCVANALRRALGMCFRYVLARAGTAHADPPEASRRFMYFNARQQENVDAKAAQLPPQPVSDGGSYPRYAMRAVQNLGFCAETVFPYTDKPQLPGETALGTINEVPPPAAFKAAYDQSGFRYYRVISTGQARVAEVARALAQGHAVIFGMFVDTAFMRNKGAPIDQVDVNDPDGGGHMLAVLEVTDTEVIPDNWWGEDWGDHGVGHFTHRLFGSSVISDVYVIQAVPTFS